MDIVSGVFGILSCCLSISFREYIDRHRKLKRDVINLESRVRDLNSRKVDIERQAEDLSEKRVRNQVEDWLDDVDRINREMQGIDEKVQNVSCLCRAHMGKLVREKIEAAERLLQQGSFSEGLVIDRPRRPATGITLPTEYLEGQVDVKETIWGYLNSNEVGMIGVYGGGGVGKTTIVKHIHSELVKMEPCRFDRVIWVIVSQSYSVRNLQHDIASNMQKNLPENVEEMTRAAELAYIMGSMKFLLILDDVWDTFTLEDVGIPRPSIENGCKVVITTRSVNVCNFSQCKAVEVNPLPKQESFNLFLDKVGLKQEALEGVDWGKILRSMVDECAGLPLAIVVIARTMKGVTDIREWRNVLRELRDGVGGITIEGQNDKIFNRLKFSYDRLRNQNIQNCFLYCSLYPEDYEFLREHLIEHWIDRRISK